MSARRPTCLPAPCATICCSVCATFRCGQPITTGATPNAAPGKLYEARRSGNIDFDLHADWIDYEAAGVADAEALSRRITEVLARLDLEEAVYTLGLRWRLDPEAIPKRPRGCSKRARRSLAGSSRTGSPTSSRPTIPSGSTLNASVAENLLFGTPIGPVFDFEALADNTYVLQVLDKVGLIEDLVEAGKQVAETMIELFADLPPDHEFFEQFSFISANDLPEFAAILGRIGEGGNRGPRQGRIARSFSRCRSS